MLWAKIMCSKAGVLHGLEPPPPPPAEPPMQKPLINEGEPV
jgi:hypothetical protein